VRRNLHDVPGVVDQPDVRADTDKRHGCALEHGHLKPVRHKPHDGRRFHPWNLLELFAAFIERDEEDVTANVAARTSITWRRVTFCIPAISIWSLESTRNRHERSP